MPVIQQALKGSIFSAAGEVGITALFCFFLFERLDTACFVRGLAATVSRAGRLVGVCEASA